MRQDEHLPCSGTFAQGGCLMYTRIPVPLPPDGLAPAESGMNSAFECAFSGPSIVSSLVDGLEAEIQTYQTAITDGVQCAVSQTFSLIGKCSTADALTVNRF